MIRSSTKDLLESDPRALINAVNSSIDDSRKHTVFEIDLIREYYTRLVADVVMGKVDVRPAAASLPDEPAGAGHGPVGADGLDGPDDPTADEDTAADAAEGRADADGDEPENAPDEEVEV